jgi:hypothetical protein
MSEESEKPTPHHHEFLKRWNAACDARYYRKDDWRTLDAAWWRTSSDASRRGIIVEAEVLVRQQGGVWPPPHVPTADEPCADVAVNVALSATRAAVMKSGRAADVLLYVTGEGYLTASRGGKILASETARELLLSLAKRVSKSG